MNMFVEVFHGGCFFSTPDLIGATIEEINLIDEGKLTTERAHQIGFNMQSAMCLLSQAECQGRC